MSKSLEQHYGKLETYIIQSDFLYVINEFALVTHFFFTYRIKQNKCNMEVYYAV